MVVFRVNVKLGLLEFASICAFSTFIIYKIKSGSLEAPKLASKQEIDVIKFQNTHNSSSSYNASAKEKSHSTLANHEIDDTNPQTTDNLYSSFNATVRQKNQPTLANPELDDTNPQNPDNSSSSYNATVREKIQPTLASIS